MENKIEVLQANLSLMQTISSKKSYSKLFPEAAGLGYETEVLLNKIRKRVDEIRGDERLSYATADIFTNAPLALIQISMEMELHTLETILGVPLTKFNELRNIKKKTKSQENN